MWPWIWFFSPNFYLPWNGNLNLPYSGAVTQDLSQSWFERYIRAGSGDAKVEQHVFEVASYGKQLGIITDLLLELAQSEDLTQRDKASEARAKLLAIQQKVEQIKALYGTR